MTDNLNKGHKAFVRDFGGTSARTEELANEAMLALFKLQTELVARDKIDDACALTALTDQVEAFSRRLVA